MEKYKIISRKGAAELGLKRYYTGKPCLHGHLSERLVDNSTCATCNNIRSKNRIKKWRQENKELSLQKHKDWVLANPEKMKECLKKSRTKHKDKMRVKRQKIYRDNKEFFQEKSREWRKNNPHKVKEIAHRRICQLSKIEGKHTAKQIRELFNKQQCKCANCISCITLTPKMPNTLHLDHIMPISKGGTNNISNIQLLCKDCNLRKHAKDPFLWAQEQGRLL